MTHTVVVHHYYKPRRPYGCFAFLLDLFMTFITSGLWIIWIIIRQLKGRR